MEDEITISNKNGELSHLFEEYSQELLLVFADDGSILFSNAEAKRELGDGESLRGKKISEIFPLVFYRNGEHVHWNEREENVHTFAYRKNQTCFPAKVKIVVGETGGVRTGVCFVINDTERNDAVRMHKKAMDRVSEVIRLKNEFTANITHELRTPINGIKGMAESLSDTELTQEQQEFVSIILKCCDNMTKIINDILDFSKIEAGKLSMERREFDFKKFLNDLLVMNAARINEKGLKLIVDVGKNVPARVVGDELRLGQVLNNLFSNAVKFTSSGHIGLEVANTYEDDKVVEMFFMVMDTGIGIAPEEKDKLFKSFSQVDGSITRRFGGTGLGLAICRQLVELMGGKITVDSEKGRGSTFSFTARFGKGGNEEEKDNYPEGRFVYEGKAGTQHERPSGAQQQASTDSFLAGSFNSTSIDEADDFQIVAEMLEKLIICLELGAWEKAESFAEIIRDRLKSNAKEWKNTSFALLLNVRKQNYDKAMELADELEGMLKNN